MRASVAAAAGGSSGEQQQATGTLEQMSVNDLQELLSNPVMVGDDEFYSATPLHPKQSRNSSSSQPLAVDPANLLSSASQHCILQRLTSAD